MTLLAVEELLRGEEGKVGSWRSGIERSAFFFFFFFFLFFCMFIVMSLLVSGGACWIVGDWRVDTWTGDVGVGEWT